MLCSLLVLSTENIWYFGFYLGKSALEINEMEKDEVLNFIDSFTFQEYDIGLENKNGKLVIRSA